MFSWSVSWLLNPKWEVVRMLIKNRILIHCRPTNTLDVWAHRVRFYVRRMHKSRYLIALDHWSLRRFISLTSSFLVFWNLCNIHAEFVRRRLFLTHFWETVIDFKPLLIVRLSGRIMFFIILRKSHTSALQLPPEFLLREFSSSEHYFVLKCFKLIILCVGLSRPLAYPSLIDLSMRI